MSVINGAKMLSTSFLFAKSYDKHNCCKSRTWLAYPVIRHVFDSRPASRSSSNSAIGKLMKYTSSGLPRKAFLTSLSKAFPANQNALLFRRPLYWSSPTKDLTVSVNRWFSPSDRPYRLHRSKILVGVSYNDDGNRDVYEPVPGTSSLSARRGVIASISYEIRSTVPPPASQTTKASPTLRLKPNECMVYRAAASGSLIKVTGERPAILAASRVAFFAASDQMAGTASIVKRIQHRGSLGCSYQTERIASCRWPCSLWGPPWKSASRRADRLLQ